MVGAEKMKFRIVKETEPNGRIYYWVQKRCWVLFFFPTWMSIEVCWTIEEAREKIKMSLKKSDWVVVE